MRFPSAIPAEKDIARAGFADHRTVHFRRNERRLFVGRDNRETLDWNSQSFQGGGLNHLLPEILEALHMERQEKCRIAKVPVSSVMQARRRRLEDPVPDNAINFVERMESGESVVVNELLDRRLACGDCLGADVPEYYWRSEGWRHEVAPTSGRFFRKSNHGVPAQRLYQ